MGRRKQKVRYTNFNPQEVEGGDLQHKDSTSPSFEPHFPRQQQHQKFKLYSQQVPNFTHPQQQQDWSTPPPLATSQSNYSAVEGWSNVNKVGRTNTNEEEELIETSNYDRVNYNSSPNSFETMNSTNESSVSSIADTASQTSSSNFNSTSSSQQRQPSFDSQIINSGSGSASHTNDWAHENARMNFHHNASHQYQPNSQMPSVVGVPYYVGGGNGPAWSNIPQYNGQSRFYEHQNTHRNVQNRYSSGGASHTIYNNGRGNGRRPSRYVHDAPPTNRDKMDNSSEVQELPDGFTKIRSKNLDVLFKRDYYSTSKSQCHTYIPVWRSPENYRDSGNASTDDSVDNESTTSPPNEVKNGVDSPPSSIHVSDVKVSDVPIDGEQRGSKKDGTGEPKNDTKVESHAKSSLNANAAPFVPSNQVQLYFYSPTSNAMIPCDSPYDYGYPTHTTMLPGGDQYGCALNNGGFYHPYPIFENTFSYAKMGISNSNNTSDFNDTEADHPGGAITPNRVEDASIFLSNPFYSSQLMYPGYYDPHYLPPPDHHSSAFNNGILMSDSRMHVDTEKLQVHNSSIPPSKFDGDGSEGNTTEIHSDMVDDTLDEPSTDIDCDQKRRRQMTSSSSVPKPTSHKSVKLSSNSGNHKSKSFRYTENETHKNMEDKPSRYGVESDVDLSVNKNSTDKDNSLIPGLVIPKKAPKRKRRKKQATHHISNFSDERCSSVQQNPSTTSTSTTTSVMHMSVSLSNLNEISKKDETTRYKILPRIRSSNEINSHHDNSSLYQINYTCTPPPLSTLSPPSSVKAFADCQSVQKSKVSTENTKKGNVESYANIVKHENLPPPSCPMSKVTVIASKLSSIPVKEVKSAESSSEVDSCVELTSDKTDYKTSARVEDVPFEVLGLVSSDMISSPTEIFESKDDGRWEVSRRKSRKSITKNGSTDSSEHQKDESVPETISTPATGEVVVEDSLENGECDNVKVVVSDTKEEGDASITSDIHENVVSVICQEINDENLVNEDEVVKECVDNNKVDTSQTTDKSGEVEEDVAPVDDEVKVNNAAEKKLEKKIKAKQRKITKRSLATENSTNVTTTTTSVSVGSKNVTNIAFKDVQSSNPVLIRDGFLDLSELRRMRQSNLISNNTSKKGSNDVLNVECIGGGGTGITNNSLDHQTRSHLLYGHPLLFDTMVISDVGFGINYGPMMLHKNEQCGRYNPPLRTEEIPLHFREVPDETPDEGSALVIASNVSECPMKEVVVEHCGIDVSKDGQQGVEISLD